MNKSQKKAVKNVVKEDVTDDPKIEAQTVEQQLTQAPVATAPASPATTPMQSAFASTVEQMLAKVNTEDLQKTAARDMRTPPAPGSAGQYDLLISGARDINDVAAVQESIVRQLARLQTRGYKVFVHIVDGRGFNRIAINLVDQILGAGAYKVYRPDFNLLGNGAGFRMDEDLVKSFTGKQNVGFLLVSDGNDKRVIELRNRALQAKINVSSRTYQGGKLIPLPIAPARTTVSA